MEDDRQKIVPLLPQLRGFARSLCSGDSQLADDLVQDTVMLALRAWHSFEPGTSLKSWLLKILHNRFHSLKRRKHHTAEVVRDDLDTLSSVPASQHSRLEVAAFKQAFAKLKPEHRTVLVLSGIHGQPYEAIAEICGCEVGTVKSRISRARAQLKAMLLGDESSPAAAAPAAGPAATKPAASALPPRQRRVNRPAAATATATAAAARPALAVPPDVSLALVKVPTPSVPAAPTILPAALAHPRSVLLAQTENEIVRLELLATRASRVAGYLARTGISMAEADALTRQVGDHLAKLHTRREQLLRGEEGGPAVVAHAA